MLPEGGVIYAVAFFPGYVVKYTVQARYYSLTTKPLEIIIVGIKFRKLSSGILLKLYSRNNFHQIFWSTSVRKLISGQNRPKLFF